MSDFEINLLKSYFRNIIAACKNKEQDERPYIKGVAESGLDVLNGLFKNRT